MNKTIDIFTPNVPVRSFADANRELVESLVRYLEARAFSPQTIRSYRDSCNRFIETMGSNSVANANRADVRVLLSELLKKGLTENSVRLHTSALRAFYKFILLTGLTTNDPTFAMAHRTAPRRLPRVLSVSDVDALIGAAKNPFEKAVAEVLYSTGVRVSELVHLRTENVDFDGRRMLVKKGKGGKDRYVLFGEKAANAIRDYWAWRRPEDGFLFERPPCQGSVVIEGPSWSGHFPVRGKMRTVILGPTARIKTKSEAQQALNRILAATPGYKQVRGRGPYSTVGIRNVLNRMAWRAGIGHVHPHALRRAMACHMLSRGADLRSIQELLGHVSVVTTQRYTYLTPDEIKAIHERTHPHEQGGKNGQAE